jgi:hypothetical protein
MLQYSDHPPMPKNSKLTDFIMVEQIKAADFRQRRAECIGRGSNELLWEVLSMAEDACIQ